MKSARNERVNVSWQIKSKGSTRRHFIHFLISAYMSQQSHMSEHLVLMYAARIPGTWWAGNVDRICVAPITTTTAGSTPSAVSERVVIDLLTKANCAAMTKEAPSTFTKAVGEKFHFPELVPVSRA